MLGRSVMDDGSNDVIKDGGGRAEVAVLRARSLWQSVFGSGKQRNKLLVSQNNTDLNLEGDLGNSPVMLACSIDNHDALSTLLLYGARLCSQNKLGHFAVHAAAFAGSKKCLEIVLKKGEELGYSFEHHLNFTDKSCSSPLHLAVHGGNIEVIKFCIDNGAKVDLQQNDKSTALHFACSQGAIDVVKLMLSSCKQEDNVINIIDGGHQTPLHKAVIFDHIELVQYLVSKRKEVMALLDDKDNEGCSPLHYACKLGVPDSVNNMLGLKVSISLKSKDKKSPLHFAAAHETLTTYKPGSVKKVPVLDMIEHLPEAAKMLLDKAIQESDDDVNSENYHENYLLTVCMILVLIMSLYAVGKEIVQIFQQIGLAVGDIAEVQRNACLKRIAMQMPFFFNLNAASDLLPKLESGDCASPIEFELKKQKFRLKDISNILQKQHNLLKLIIEKMEIVSEADEQDDPDLFSYGNVKRQHLLNKKSKWDSVIKAVHAKKE
ncbi:TRPA1 protein, partial [Polypterus senegalus]